MCKIQSFDPMKYLKGKNIPISSGTTTTQDYKSLKKKTIFLKKTKKEKRTKRMQGKIL